MAIIPKGCTAVNTFSFPYTESETDVLFVTYQQNKKTVIEKEKADVVFQDGKINIYLSQEDTLALNNGSQVKIQIRAKLTDNSVVKSQVITAATDELLKDEVI